MCVLAGILVVVIAVLGGFLMEKGSIATLYQPAEWMIIAGGALGALVLGNPAHVVSSLFKRLPKILRKSRYTEDHYLNALAMLYELFSLAQGKGMRGLENEIESPESGQVLKKYPGFLADERARAFLCDTLRMLSLSNSKPEDLTEAMEHDLEVLHVDLEQPASALLTVADALPGFGIVAAVLGIIVTMQSLTARKEEIGVHVASALAGTFVGILLSYGFAGPIAARLNKVSDREFQYFEFLRIGMAAYIRGSSPRIAAEFARRSIPSSVRPGLQKMEMRCLRSKRPVEA